MPAARLAYSAVPGSKNKKRSLLPAKRYAGYEEPHADIPRDCVGEVRSQSGNYNRFKSLTEQWID
jgi:hypothetical protein